MNQEHLRCYARLLVEHAVALRRGQPLYVYGQVAHRHLMAMVTELAYQAGGGPVETRLFDPLQQATLVRHGRFEDIELWHTRDQAWLSEIVLHGGAFISLAGSEFPHLWDEVARSHPDRHAAYLRGLTAATSGFYRYAMERRCCPWVAATCPTAGWAREVFPELSPGAALDRLAAQIFRFVDADQDDAIELARARARLLKARCRKLDALGITALSVTGGQSDFRLALSGKARWQGGSQTTVTGQTFYCNVPSEEVYTTPDKRMTEGRLAATRPFRLPAGPLIKDLVLDFRDGRVIELDASSGREALCRWLETDDGARYLGEFALIGEDSPIARSGIFFDSLILDENAAAHVALGKAFASAVDGGESMDLRQLEALGLNQSNIHTDIMFGSAEVTIVATESREGEVGLIDRGRWEKRFLEAS